MNEGLPLRGREQTVYVCKRLVVTDVECLNKDLETCITCLQAKVNELQAWQDDLYKEEPSE